METIIIGKPAVNVYLPLQEFPQEGDVFTIKGKNESVGNIGATTACLLGKWGMPVHFTGVVGNDAYAEKIRDTFKEYKVNSKFMETNFEKGTSVNYNILNVKNGIVSKVLYNDPDNQLTKFKYDFVPGFAVIDGTDFAGAHALLNNNGSCKTVFYGRFGDKDTIAMSKRCTWVVCTQVFAELLAKTETDGTAESFVNLYQHIVDNAGNSNYIVILNNHKILYSVEGKVKMLPEMKINVADYSSFDSVFVGALSFALMKDMVLDDAIKLANTAAAISLSKIGEVPSIPELDEVIENSGLREKLGGGENQTPVAQAQAVEPLNPSYQSTTVEETPQVEENKSQDANLAFGASPVVETQVVEQAPVEETVATPVEMPMPQQVTPTPQVETNMFDNPNV